MRIQGRSSELTWSPSSTIHRLSTWRWLRIELACTGQWTRRVKGTAPSLEPFPYVAQIIAWVGWLLKRASRQSPHQHHRHRPNLLSQYLNPTPSHPIKNCHLQDAYAPRTTQWHSCHPKQHLQSLERWRWSVLSRLDLTLRQGHRPRHWLNYSLLWLAWGNPCQ